MKKYIGALSILVSIYSPLSFAGVNYQIKITNITRGQIFTPILVATHSAEIKAFSVGYNRQFLNL